MLVENQENDQVNQTQVCVKVFSDIPFGVFIHILCLYKWLAHNNFLI